MLIQKISSFNNTTNTTNTINIKQKAFSTPFFGTRQTRAQEDEFVSSRIQKPNENPAAIKKKAQAILHEIDLANTVVVLTHECADGDGIGSGLALVHTIHDYFPEKQINFVVPDGIPSKLRGLPGTELIITGDEIPENNYDLAILVDCDESIAGGKELFKNAKKRVNFDHHSTNKEHESKNELIVKDKKMASNTSVIYNNFIKPLDIKLTPEAAECLLTGILTDTDNFKYFKNTNKELSLENSDDLQEILKNYDISIDTINEKMQNNDEISEGLENLCNDILDGKGVHQLQTETGDDIIYAIIGNKKLNQYGITDSSTDIKAKLTKLNYQLKENNSAEFSVLFYELPSGKIRASIRSKSIKIDKFASDIGGGGHEYAAGVTLEGNKKEAIKQFLEELQTYEFKTPIKESNTRT